MPSHPISDDILDLIRGRRSPPPQPPPPTSPAPIPQSFDIPRIELPAADEEARNFELAQEFERRGLPFRSDLGVGASLEEVNRALEAKLTARGPEEPIRARQAQAGPFRPIQQTIEEEAGLLVSRFPQILDFIGARGQEVQDRARELREQGLSTTRAAQQAFQEVDQPSAKVTAVPFGGIPLPGGKRLEQVDLGVKGALELALDPTVVLPGIGFGGAIARGGRGAIRGLGRAPGAIAREVSTTPNLRGSLTAPARAVRETPEAAVRAVGEGQITPVGQAPAIRAAPAVREAAETVPASVVTEPASPEQLALGAPAERLALAAPEAPTPTTAVERAAIPLSGEVPVGRQALPQPSTASAPPTPAGLMAPADADETVKWFGALLSSPDTARAMELTTELRAHALGRRFAAFQTRAKQLVDEGVAPEDAIKQARQELTGELPRIQTGVESVITEEVRNALFSRVYTVLVNDVPEQLATVTALTNALLGKPIPRTPGIAGGSAFSRLSRIFPPEIVAVLGKSQSLDELLLSKFPPPRGVSSVDIASSVPFGQARLGEQAIPLRQLPPDLRSATQRDLELLDFRASVAGRARGISESVDFAPSGALDAPQQARLLNEPFVERQLSLDPRTRSERQLDLETFKTSLADPPPAAGGGRPPLGPVDEVVIGQLRQQDPEFMERLLAAARVGGGQVVDAANLIRSNVASFDLSYLRQQALLIPSNPVPFGQSFYDSLRSLWSAQYAEDIMQAIFNDPLFAIYDRIGADFLRPLNSKVAGLYEAAEDFMILSRVAGETLPRPFQAIAERLPWIRISARAHIIGTNSMNWRIFKNYYKELLNMNELIAAGSMKAPKNFSIEKSLKSSASMLADMSGRGPLGPLKSVSPALNGFFFSVRLNIGRLIAPRHLFSADPFTRKKAWKNFTVAIGTYGSFILAGQQMGLWDVERDPRSADFMKIILAGRTRIDIWGGMQQFVVLYGRLLSVLGTGELTPQLKSTEAGLVSETDPIELGGRLARTKASPALSNVLEGWVGEDFKGSEIDRTDWKRWLARNAPIAGQDIYEVYNAHGLTGLPLAVAGALGAGVVSYDLPRWPELDEYYRFSEGRSQRHANTLRLRFRQNPDNEAKLFLRGQITTLTADGARRRVLELMREFKVDPADVPGFENVFGSVRR